MGNMHQRRKQVHKHPCLYIPVQTAHAFSVSVQEQSDAKLLLRYTLQQQHQQQSRQQHTDAWLDTASTAGQRALQVGDDPKWVVIPSSGLQRTAANVGAGGMVKKNLPVSPVLTLRSASALLWGETSPSLF